MPTRTERAGVLDPITFSILQHRLWAINAEQGSIAATLSGSPIFYDAHEFNSALLTPDGELLIVGEYVTFQAAGLDLAVKSIIALFSDDAGIHDGDMFITNDPWAGALHMNDVVVVSPVIWEGEIIMWTAVVAHEQDVGGPVPGGFVVGHKDVFGEAPIIPPLKLVERGRVRKEVEAVYLRNTRTPGPTAVDIRARIKAQNVTGKRIRDLVTRYGRDTVLAVQHQIMEHVRSTVRARLSELPDGTWFDQCFLDHDGTENVFYQLKLSMRKGKDHLHFDYRGSSAQAPGSINCTMSGLRGGVLTAVLPMLCYDLPWCSGGLQGVVDIEAEEGSIVNALYPAGVSMGAMGAAWAVSTLATTNIARMYACSDKYKPEVQSCWYPSRTITTISGQDQYGRPMVNFMSDSGAGGGGARGTCDGIDTSGSRSSILMVIPNVESNEQKLSVLQVYRKQRQDACGCGKFRGGVGMEYMLIPYHNPTSIATLNAGHGVSLPGGPGVYGGLPPAVQRSMILRHTNIQELFAAGKIPTDPQELECEGKDILGAKDRSLLDGTDAYVVCLAGGGGYGDPLTRDPLLVEKDVRAGLCSLAIARDVYGVFASEEGRVDLKRTELRRSALRAQRLAASRPVQLAEQTTGDMAEGLNGHHDSHPAPTRLMPIGEHLQVVARDGKAVVECVHCGHCYGPAGLDPKMASVMRAASITEISPLNQYGLVEEVVVNEYFCPGCGTMIAANVQRREDLPYAETRLSL